MVKEDKVHRNVKVRQKMYVAVLSVNEAIQNNCIPEKCYNLPEKQVEIPNPTI